MVRVAFLLLMPLVMLTVAPALGSLAWAQGEDPLAQGTELYNQGNFQEAADLLRTALGSNQVPTADQEAARELLARSLVKSGARLEARNVFIDILQRDAGYRADPNKVPPDEIGVFAEALREFKSRQMMLTSLGGFGGMGFFSAGDFNDMVEEFDAGADEKKSGAEFGGSVRVPIRPKFSLEFELSHLRTETTGESDTKFEQSAMPLVVNGIFEIKGGSNLRMYGLVGAGPLLGGELKATVDVFGLELSYGDSKTGIYLHGGLETEYLVTERFALNLRLLGRLARGGKLEFPDIPTFPLHDKGVDFSGFAVQVGARAYIGY
jgi:hypothetical protein